MAFGIAPVIGEPRFGTAVTATPRKVLRGSATEAFLPGGKVIDGVKSRDTSNTPIDVLQAGKLMGKITATGLWANSVIGSTTVAYAGGTSLTVGVPTATEIVRRIGASGTFKILGPPAASGVVSLQTVTYSAVVTSTGVITVTAIGSNFVAGSLILPTDGSEDMLSFVPDFGQSAYGIKTTDNDGTNTQVTAVPFPLVPIEGVINSPSLIDWPADTSIQAYIKSAMSMAGFGKFVFDDGYG
jgi:hypothetical protein